MPPLQQKLTLKIKLSSLNKFRTSHWRTQYKMKKELEALVFYEVKNQKIKPIKTPCFFTFFITVGDKRHKDIDNIGSLAMKFVFDGLRYAGVLEDDTILHIPKVTIEAIQGTEDKLEIYFN